jgi:hypothetical protein
MMAMFHVANPVGRLLEIRVASPLSLYDAMTLFKQIYRVMPRERGLACVIADLRNLHVVEPEVIDLVSGYMRMDNLYVERNAFLLPDTDASATVLSLSEELVNQINAPSRRLFRVRAEAEKWIGEVTSDIERARMKAFLDEHVPSD